MTGEIEVGSNVSISKSNKNLEKLLNNCIDNRSCNKPTNKVWFRGVRSSRFRHVYGEPARREKCYDTINITKNAHDSQFCAVNPKFVAIVTEVAGGGAFVIIPIDKTGRLDFNASRVTGHTGPVLDLKWNPFDDNVIASCSDDCSIKLWQIPDGGLMMHLTNFMMELQGHKRRVSYIEWHPTAENILFSAGFDHLIIIWNVENGYIVNAIDCHPDVIYSMSLNRDGSLLATTCKDKKLRIIEPRTGIVKSSGICHNGSKSSKVAYLGSSGRLITTGFSRYSDRQYAVWNENDLSAPLITDNIDSSSGVVSPFYDFDTDMVYLAGKGDGNIRYYEITKEAPYIHFLSQFLSGNPQRGLGAMPKRGLRTNQCEIFRFYKLHTTKGICEPVSMIVPRKSDQFHNDLYPDTAAPRPALSANDWIKGMNAMPILMAMKTVYTIGINGTALKQSRTFKPTNMVTASTDNNKKKFTFLSTETIPDYRPKNLITQKELKTNTNQTTKFQQIQQRFGQYDTVVNNNVQSLNGIHDFDYNNINEQDLKMAYMLQCDEMRRLRKQLNNSEKRIQELEDQIYALINE